MPGKLILVMQGVSEIRVVLQWYSKCYCVASVTKTFTPKGIQLSIVQGVEGWTVRTPLSVSVFVTLATR
jgi:hypothetical protein